MKHYILAASLGFAALAACSAQDQAKQTDKLVVQSAASPIADGGISISAPYVLPPFPGRDVAAGFFELQNNGTADRLISASSPDSTAVEIHNHIEDDGIMRMRKVEGVALETGDVVRFEPGSYHLMLFGVNLKDGQENIDVTLNYENSGPVTLTVPIRQHGDDGDDNDEAGANSNGSGSYGSGAENANSKGSGTKGSGSHYGSGSKSDDKADKKKTYGSGQ